MMLSSCSVKKFIPEEERLYTGASVEIETEAEIQNLKQLEAVLEEVLRPKPNKSFLGMPLGLYFHYKMQKDNPGFINRFFYKRMGQEPVYQSDVKPFEVNEILLNRLENRGFFYSSVDYDFHEKEKEASVTYSVKVPEPYLMERYQLDSLPEPIHSEIEKSVSATKFEKGMRFDLNHMKHERERIDKDLKSNGYYNFNSNFLIFEADTNQYDKKRFDLFLRLKKETPEKSIIPYRISKINVYADYDAQDFDDDSKEVARFNDKNYINNENFFKPKHLDPFITMSEGQYYSPEDSRNTARRLSTIGAYKFVNIQYTEVDSVLTDRSEERRVGKVYRER